MFDETGRRSMLKGVGLTVAGGLVGSTTVAAEEPDPRGSPVTGTSPPGGKETVVSAWGRKDSAETGEFITHALGWVFKTQDGEDLEDTKAHAREFVTELTTHSFTIEGDEVGSPEDYWGDPMEIEDGEGPEGYDVRIRWTYTIPPQPPGTYRYEIDVEFHDREDGEFFPVGQDITVSSRGGN